MVILLKATSTKPSHTLRGFRLPNWGMIAHPRHPVGWWTTEMAPSRVR
jgi:hypothetical protein